MVASNFTFSLAKQIKRKKKSTQDINHEDLHHKWRKWKQKISINFTFFIFDSIDTY